MIRARTARFTLAACTAAALVFGGAQALAAPAAPSQERVCSNRECKAYCAAKGADGGCVGGMCVCRIPVE